MRTRVLWLFLIIAGCADRERPISATGAPRSVPATSATQWVATFDSVGPVAAGSRYSAVARSFGVTQARIPADEDAVACDYVDLPGMPPGVSLMVFRDSIVRIDIDTTGVQTREGIGVGSLESAVLDAYRGRARIESHPYSGPDWHYVIVTPSRDSTYRMIFETDGLTVHSFRVGLRGAVDLIEGCS